jgi:hypothetical protein
LKVFDLHCTQQHPFEGWFASEDEFQRQLGAGLVGCPMCGDTAVAKKLSAPRLNLGAVKEPVAARQDVMVPEDAAQQAAWLRKLRRVVASTEDVGERFAEEARRMHYGEAEERSIRGQASREETRALLEEGIPVLPLPRALAEPLQ